MSLAEARFPAGSLLILTLQGFGQHEPLIWLDLHGCSYVRTSSSKATFGYRIYVTEAVRFAAMSEILPPTGAKRSEISYRQEYARQATIPRWMADLSCDFRRSILFL